MKVLGVSLLVVMIFSLTSGICCAQTAKDYYDKGIEYGVAREFRKAQQEFTKALDVYPFYGLAKVGLEITKDTLKQTIKTETALYIFKGATYYLKGMYDEVIDEYEKAIEVNPKLVGAYYNLGVTYGKRGKKPLEKGGFRVMQEGKKHSVEDYQNYVLMIRGEEQWRKRMPNMIFVRVVQPVPFMD